MLNFLTGDVIILEMASFVYSVFHFGTLLYPNLGANNTKRTQIRYLSQDDLRVNECFVVLAIKALKGDIGLQWKIVKLRSP